MCADHVIDFTVRPSTVWEVARSKGLPLHGRGDCHALKTALRHLPPSDLSKWLRCFLNTKSVIRGDLDCLERASLEICEDSAKAGHRHVVINFWPFDWLIEGSFDVYIDDLVERVKQGLDRGQNMYGITVHLNLHTMDYNTVASTSDVFVNDGTDLQYVQFCSPLCVIEDNEEDIIVPQTFPPHASSEMQPRLASISSNCNLVTELCPLQDNMAPLHASSGMQARLASISSTYSKAVQDDVEHMKVPQMDAVHAIEKLVVAKDWASLHSEAMVAIATITVKNGFSSDDVQEEKNRYVFLAVASKLKLQPDLGTIVNSCTKDEGGENELGVILENKGRKINLVIQCVEHCRDFEFIEKEIDSDKANGGDCEVKNVVTVNDELSINYDVVVPVEMDYETEVYKIEDNLSFQINRIMPKHKELTEEEKEAFSGGAGTTADTKFKKASHYKLFVHYVFQKENIDCENMNDVQLEEAVENFLNLSSDDQIADHFTSYFQTMRVENKEQQEDGSFLIIESRPKKKYAEAIKSHVKMSFLERHKIDLTDKARFPEERLKWQGFLKVLKSEGRGDTKHHTELPPAVLEKTTSLFTLAMHCLEQRGKPGYWRLLQLIPAGWRNKLNYLLTYGAIFIVISYDGRRGFEGIDSLTKKHLRLTEDGEFEFKFFQKVLGEGSKNHQSDSENANHAGIIPYLNTQSIKITGNLQLGFNPGLYFEKYLKYLPEDSDYLFPQPKLESKKFDLNDATTMCLFESNKKIGPKTVQHMMPTVCEIIKEPRQTNHQIRVTVIRSLKRTGYTYADISKITGHKNVMTMMENYDPGLDVAEKANMAAAISTAAVLQKGYEFKPVSDHLKRRDNGDELVTYNKPIDMLADQTKSEVTIEDISDDDNEGFPELTCEEMDAFYITEAPENDLSSGPSFLTNKAKEDDQPGVKTIDKNESSKQSGQHIPMKSKYKPFEENIECTKRQNISLSLKKNKNNLQKSTASREALKEKSNQGEFNNNPSKSAATVGMYDKENGSHSNYNQVEQISIESPIKTPQFVSPPKPKKSLQEEFNKLSTHKERYKAKLMRENKNMTNSDKEKWLNAKHSIVRRFMSDPDSSPNDLKLAKDFLEKYEHWKLKKVVSASKNEKVTVSNASMISPKIKQKYMTIDLTQPDREKIFKSPPKSMKLEYKVKDLTKDGNCEQNEKEIDLKKDEDLSNTSEVHQGIMMNPLMGQSTMMNPGMSQSTMMNPGMSQSTLMNPQMSQCTMMNPQMSQCTMMNPQMSQCTMMNPLMGHGTMMNPLIGQGTMMNPQMGQSTMMNPQMGQSTMMNPQLAQNTMMNNQMSQSTMMNPQMGQSTMMNRQISQSTMMNPQMSQSTMMIPQMSQSTMMNPQMAQSTMMNQSSMMNSQMGQYSMIPNSQMNRPIMQNWMSPFATQQPVLMTNNYPQHMISQVSQSQDELNEITKTISVKRADKIGGVTETVAISSTRKRNYPDWSVSLAKK